MRNCTKVFLAGIAGFLALGVSAAFAGYKPDYCAIDHDHRSHSAHYYDYYPADKYYRAGPYRDSGVSFSFAISDGYYDRAHYRHGRRHYDDRYDRRHYGRRHGYRGRGARIVNREVFDTRYRARIVLIEEAVRTRRGPRLVCTVEARGPEARYVSERRMRRIARNYCSRRANIRVFA